MLVLMIVHIALDRYTTTHYNDYLEILNFVIIVILLLCLIAGLILT